MKLQKVSVLVLAVLSVCATASHSAILYKYDDFDNAATSATLWTKSVTSPGAATFDGTQAVLDMTSPAAGKRAFITANNSSVVFNNVGDSFRITWDQRILTDGATTPFASSFTNGFAFYPGFGSIVIRGGQSGNGQGDRFFFLANGGTPTATDTTSRSIANFYHYDLSMTLLSSASTLNATATFTVYAFNNLNNNNPNAYTTPIFTSVIPTFTMLTGTILKPIFYAEVPAPDPSAFARAKIAVDNVFVTPEPTMGTLVLMAGAVMLRRRRRNVVPLAALA